MHVEPTETLESQVLTNPASACVEVSSKCEQPWFVPSFMNSSYGVDFDCVANFGLGKFSEKKCENNGGELISFGVGDYGKDVFALQDALTNPQG